MSPSKGNGSPSKMGDAALAQAVGARLSSKVGAGVHHTLNRSASMYSSEQVTLLKEVLRDYIH